MTVGPARLVPVAAEVSGADGNDHEMPEAGLDLLVAAGAQVRLDGLERLDGADLDRVPTVRPYRGIRTHNSRAATTMKAAASIR